MANELEKAMDTLPADRKTLSMVTEGHHNIQVGYTPAFSPTMNVVLMDSGDKRTQMGTDYYNLFIGYDPFEKEHFTVTEDRALMEYISDEMKARFFPPVGENVNEIKKYPALIVEETTIRQAGEREAAFAFITDIKRRENGYEIYFKEWKRIGMEIVCGSMFEFGILHQFELTRTHWSIKQINLVEVLYDKGIKII